MKPYGLPLPVALLPALLVALLMAAAGCDRGLPEPQVAADPVGAAAADSGESLPVADVAVLKKLIAEAAAADQVLVIDFWATWCVPCVEMFPQLHAGLEAMGDAVRPVTVSFDDPGGTEANAITFLRQHDAMDDAYILSITDGSRAQVVDELGDQWNMLAVPAILVFDREGRLAGEFLDAQPAPILQRVRELTPDS